MVGVSLVLAAQVLYVANESRAPGSGPAMWPTTAVVVALGAVLFTIPLILWSQSAIPRYGTAAILALGITAAYDVSATVFLSRIERRRGSDPASSDQDAISDGGAPTT